MKRLVATSVIAGIIAGLLVGGFYNLFQVPVMERAIALEEERAASVSPSGSTDESGPEVSLGVQRIGMIAGTAIYGAVIGIFFAAGFVLLHRAAPGWPVVWVALTVGALGFWSLSLFSFIRYPVNPPGVGDEATLLARQLGQVLFMLISAAAVGIALDAVKRIHQNFAEFSARRIWYGGALGVYAVLALVMVFVFPGNPTSGPCTRRPAGTVPGVDHGWPVPDVGPAGSGGDRRPVVAPAFGVRSDLSPGRSNRSGPVILSTVVEGKVNDH